MQERLREDRERARFFEGEELPVVESAVTVATGSSFRSLSPSVAPSTTEETLTLSRSNPPWRGKEAGGMLTWVEEWRSLREKVQFPWPQVHPRIWTGEAVFFLCQVGEQQAARVEVKGPKRRAVIRVESEETQDYVLKKLLMKISVRKKCRRFVSCRAR